MKHKFHSILDSLWSSITFTFCVKIPVIYIYIYIYTYIYIYNKYITNNIAIYNITKYITIYNICNKCLQINILYIYIYTYSSPFFLATPQSQCLMMIERDGSLSTLCHSCGLWAYVSEEGVQKTFPGPGYLNSKDG